MADLEIVSMSHLANIPDVLRERIVARARETSKVKDGVGADIQPREAQEALLNVARREIEDELRAAALPKVATEAELAQWRLEKAAFGKKRSLAGQGALVKAVGAEKAAAIAAEWGTKLGDIATRGRNPYKAAMQAAKAEKKAEPLFDGTPFNRAMGRPYEDGREKQSKNPYKREPSPQRDKEIVGVIARKGTAFAASLAKAAGCSISGKPLNV
jgi:hypothetical protein